MRPSDWSGYRRAVKALRGLVPSYDTAQGARIGADARSYKASSLFNNKFLVGLVALTLMVCASVWWFFPKENRESSLRDQLRVALSKSDYDQAHSLMASLCQRRPTTPNISGGVRLSKSSASDRRLQSIFANDWPTAGSDLRCYGWLTTISAWTACILGPSKIIVTSRLC